jgi:hypothetical protein
VVSIDGMAISRAYLNTPSAKGAFVFVIQDLAPMLLRFRIMAPSATQGTALEKYGRSDSGTVIGAKALNI